ncbi:MAG: DUF4097 family beta strand repeat-containing protein [Phycisphaerales bacterium]
MISMVTPRALASFVVAAAVLPLAACLPLDGRAERHLVQNEPAPKSLEISSMFLDVDVALAATSEVGVRADVVLQTSGGNETAEREIEHVTVHVVRDGDKLVVRQGDANSSWNFSGNHSGNGKISVTLPANIPLAIKTASGDVHMSGDFGATDVNIATASGDMALRGLGVNSLTVNTASGDAAIDVLRPLAKFRFEAASGDLGFKGGADAVDVSTASGDVAVSGLRGPATVNTASGDVKLLWSDTASLPATTSIVISTASGDVGLTLPKGTDPAGSISTASGGIASEAPIQVAGRLGSSSGSFMGKGPTLRISTASGDVTIHLLP